MGQTAIGIVAYDGRNHWQAVGTRFEALGKTSMGSTRYGQETVSLLDDRFKAHYDTRAN